MPKSLVMLAKWGWTAFISIIACKQAVLLLCPSQELWRVLPAVLTWQGTVGVVRMRDMFGILVTK